MLTNLLIKNYVLIDDLELVVSPGLTIITGETGAGKSVLLGAIGLLLGQRAETKVLFNPESKCVIEGTFDLSGYGLQDLFESEELDYSSLTFIRREITPSGKSRAFINDTPVNLDLLKRVSERLVDIHSQHDSILLANGTVQTDLLDAFAGNKQLYADYRQRYNDFYQAEESLNRLTAEAAGIRKEHDYNQYLWQELENAGIREGELENLENEQAVLENALEIKSRFHEMSGHLENQEVSALSLLNEVAHLLHQAQRIVPTYQPLSKRLDDVLIELKDLAGEITDIAENIEVNDERTALVNERLDLLYQLMKKHQVEDLNLLAALKDDLRQKVGKFENLDSVLQEARHKAESARTSMLDFGAALSKSRKAAAVPFEQLVTNIVRELGITHGVFKVNISDLSIPAKSGVDKVEFLFSANKGIAPQPLKNVASGGEFSRLMLAFKYAVAEKKQLATLIFDEIDSGISGEIARKMGEMIRQMGQQHQVIAITHLHQIAAFGNSHLHVYKDNSNQTTVSRIKRLSEEDRIMELAQMIGGENPSHSVVANARELLNKSL